jgi:hypothetical protein
MSLRDVFTSWQSVCFSVSIIRLLRSYFARNDEDLRHCEEARRGNLFVSQFQFMRLLRSYFPRNDNGLRHCETFLRRGNLFVIIVIARRHDAAICLFLSFNHEITSVILSS